MIKKILHRTSGFTFVELMVAISIIGILSAIVYANFGQARAAARDDIRKTDLKNLQLAIELYKAQNGRYPLRGCLNTGESVGIWSGADLTTAGSLEDCDNYVEGLVPDYIDSLPRDPRVTFANSGYIYRTNSNTSPTEYKLMAYRSVEAKQITSYDDEMARCPSQAPSGPCVNPFPQITAQDLQLHRTYAIYRGAAAQFY